MMNSSDPLLSADPLLSVEHLQTFFDTDEGVVKAVDDVSLVVRRGATLGLVGESGCGKSVTALSIIGLVAPPGRIAGGRITLQADGRRLELTSLPKAELRRIRGGSISMIFQEPMTSLNPVFTVGAQIAEVVRLHHRAGRVEARRRAVEMLRKVGIPEPQERARQYPHQFSGGMRQRAMIAMALACQAKLLIADEPTTALDVTIQAQILDLLRQLQADFGMAVLFITHDLGVTAEMASDVAVMYASKIVESAAVSELFEHPLHPYTHLLFKSRPRPGRAKDRRLETIEGTVPSPLRFPRGCKFHPRCPFRQPRCQIEEPELWEARPGHQARCHFAGALYFDRG
ncbi:MAG: ABC transporter ATP-binding protein [Thermoguttaceae bacterium]|jgi:oligopeptide/dipeptide ABC transporter ATP-binding protein